MIWGGCIIDNLPKEWEWGWRELSETSWRGQMREFGPVTRSKGWLLQSAPLSSLALASSSRRRASAKLDPLASEQVIHPFSHSHTSLIVILIRLNTSIYCYVVYTFLILTRSYQMNDQGSSLRSSLPWGLTGWLLTSGSFNKRQKDWKGSAIVQECAYALGGPRMDCACVLWFSSLDWRTTVALCSIPTTKYHREA